MNFVCDVVGCGCSRRCRPQTLPPPPPLGLLPHSIHANAAAQSLPSSLPGPARTPRHNGYNGTTHSRRETSASGSRSSPLLLTSLTRDLLAPKLLFRLIGRARSSLLGRISSRNSALASRLWLGLAWLGLAWLGLANARSAAEYDRKTATKELGRLAKLPTGDARAHASAQGCSL